MRQLSPPYSYDGLFGAQTCVRLSFVLEEQYFRLCVVEGNRKRGGFRILSVSIWWWSGFTVVSLGKKISRITPSSSQKTFTKFFQLTAHSWISYSLGISYCSISSTEGWIHVQNEEPKFHPPCRYATRNLHLHCLVGANISDDCFPCLYAAAACVTSNEHRTLNSPDLY